MPKEKLCANIVRTTLGQVARVVATLAGKLSSRTLGSWGHLLACDRYHRRRIAASYAGRCKRRDSDTSSRCRFKHIHPRR